jgi:5-methylcytosine-specific restriction endonuclease McrA
MDTDRLTPRQRLSHKLRDGKYRARKMGCPYEDVTIAQAEAAGLLAETRCCYCGCEIKPGELYTLEHKEPLKLGGSHTLGNLAKACPECNEEKHIQTELEYMARLDSRLFGR